MADEQSVQLVACIFGWRSFAYKRLAQSLNKSCSTFTSVIRDYLDPVVKADWCAQYVDGIALSADTSSELIENLDLVF